MGEFHPMRLRWSVDGTFRARDGARGPGDLGFARTEAERRRLNLRALAGLEKNKDDTFVSSLFFRARDGDRTRDPLLGKEVLHR